ncbi:hypothetical protein ABC977_02290 [Thioalkalicoccus limnaeus]|uniref:Uncharacterized protein n=1 Tax=Thioalkalicoccus limnaeus TaxID=120681 RepID=A0ABV4BD11_9GAMM
MQIFRCSSFAAAAAAAALAVTVLAPKPAEAQSAACVNLLVGAGYAAWMGVEFAGTYHWSSSFPIGQHRCIKLPVKDMVDGNTYRVVVSAVLGSSKVPCTPEPSPYSSSNTSSVVYNAWGTTLNVHCEMPSAETTAVVEGVDITPSEAGLKALEKHKTEGELPPPTE